MLLVVFRELSDALTRFSRLEVRLFLKFVSSDDLMTLVKYHRKSIIFGPTFPRHCIFLETDLLRQNSKQDPAETEKCSRKPSEKYVMDLEESIGVFGRPAELIGYDQPKLSVLRAQKSFSIVVSQIP